MSALFVVAICGTLGCTRNTPPKCFEDRSEDKELSTAELKAIINVFGEHAYKMNISSTKSMTGHLLGAAGAIEGIAAIMAIKNDTIPPTINHTTPDPDIDPKLNLTLNTMQKRVVNIAISNTFGFGGHNAAVVLKKFNS